MSVNPAPPANGQKQAAVPPVPFRKAALYKSTLMGSFALSATLADRVNTEIDSKGYMATLRLFVSGSETTSTADPGASADFPWALFRRLELRDTAGGLLYSCKGYSAYIAERFFHPYSGRNLDGVSDVRVYTVSISAVQANTIAFSVGIHVEAGTRDNLGLVPNQNASFKYTLTTEVAPEADIVTTPANAAWALSVQPAYDYYSVPAPMRADGRPQATMPPFAGVVRQQQDTTIPIPSTAEQRLALTVGRVYRGIVLITRNSSHVRVNGLSRLKLKFGDDNLLFDFTEQDLLERAYRLWGIATIPTGVYPLTFAADNDMYVGADFRRDLIDTRRISQIYFEYTPQNSTAEVDLLTDHAIVPSAMSL